MSRLTGARSNPITNLERCIGNNARSKGTYLIPAFFIEPPSTVVIYNTTTTDGSWNAIATGLSDVLYWRLSEQDGGLFDYAFVAAPATFMTAYGWVGGNSAPTAIYARRQSSSSTNITIQLEVWTK